MKNIIKFLKAKSNKPKAHGHTNWEYAIIVYNSEHYDLDYKNTDQITEFKSESEPLPINLPIPNYLSLF